VAFERQVSRSRYYVWIVVVVSVAVYAITWSYLAYARLAAQLSGLGGVALGDTRGDVRYKRGDPPFVYGTAEPGQSTVRVYYTDRQKDPDNAVPEGTDVDTYPTWSYANSPTLQIRLDVTFDPKLGRASKIDCTDRSDPPTFYCGRVAGIGIWDAESRISLLLGKPTQQWIDDKTGVKTMDYRDIGVMFLLKKQRVFGISVTGLQARKPIPADRFLKWVAGTFWLWSQL
jgi:hypothetical protein